MLRLPDDVLLLLVDFVQSPTASRVCVRLRDLLRFRYVQMRVPASEFDQAMAHLAGDIHRSLSLSVWCSQKRLGFDSLAMGDSLRVLATAKWLQRCSLQLYCCNACDKGAVEIAKLRCMPLLHTLTLNLGANCLSDVGVEALALLRHAPSLRHLDLDLSNNLRIQARGAGALATLKSSATLVSLRLNLCNNHVGNAPKHSI